MLVEDWDSLSENILEQAIDESYSEGKGLEFKRELNPADSGHKSKLLGEVTSFANSGGGDLVIGIVDDEGVATGFWPTQYDDIDEITDRWVNIIKRNTDPEIPQHLIEIESIFVDDAQSEYLHEDCPDDRGHILVMRVRRSWRAPHREVINNRFYERSASGKSELDTGAIRRAMLQGEVFVERAKEFRNNRISEIQSDELPFSVHDVPKVILHVIPSNAFGFESVLDPQTAKPDPFDDESISPELLATRSDTGNWARFTEDGFLLGRRDQDEESRVGRYTLTFRSGAIEAMTAGAAIYSDDHEVEYISTPYIRNCLEQVFESYLRFLNRADAAYPFYGFISIIGGKGMPACTIEQIRWPSELETIDREIVRPPAVIINSPADDVENHIDEILDRIANASGFAEDSS